MNKTIAVLIPCYNEELTIAKVINDFQQELPQSDIYVYNNNSTDKTANIAIKEGAILREVPKKGKGNVIRNMFLEIDADIYIMIDGDDTYPVSDVHKLIQTIKNGEADMCIGDRHSNGSYKEQNKRQLHNFGNKLVTKLINSLYKEDLKDIMSGFRAFSKEFVKHFPIHSSGFEIETEMSMHALDKRFKIIEIPIGYIDRIEGSVSKLNTYSDGLKILKTIFWLFKNYKPLAFFTSFSALFFLLSIIVGIPVIIEYFQTSLVDKIPSAILAVGLMIISIMSLFSGFLLDTIVRQHRENFELSRLSKKYYKETYEY